MKKFLPLVAAVILFAACDKIEGPYSEKPTGNGSDTGAVRRILIEDFTGQKCGNCPRAAETIESLKGIYGDRIVTYGIHAGFFAVPSTGGTKFLTDYRTPDGDIIDQFFGNSAAGLPNGLINRSNAGGSYIQSYSNWGSLVGQMLNAEPDARIKINNTYNSTTRQVSTTINTSILNNLNGNYKLCVVVTEDSIVGWQKDYQLNPTDIEFYTHRHVYRGAMNTAWGTDIGTGSLVEGDTYTGSFNMTLNPAWDAAHCYVVAYVYNASTKEVVQVEEKEIIQ
ncbi:MAG: Omp28 family outer membrane lipoprotein [Sphingobacteriales bacterium JAD_PAG50586_3]|nr:MAG: Omp28 family outer membrane lipoprotein [Sphingobacteriales bacterium JAD_PAG50586_3]